jgi:hypothetical protein
MATILRPMRHASDPGREAIEVFDESGEFLATLYPISDGTGIRLITKHGVTVSIEPETSVTKNNLKSVKVEIAKGGPNGQA